MSQCKPYPAYKDSGVEWLGRVPQHWSYSPLKYLVVSIESGTSVNATDTPAAEGEYGVLKTSCVYGGKFDPTENKAILPEEYERAACPVVAGALIVSRMNTPDLVGAAGLVSEAPEGIFLPDRLWQISFSELTPSFAYYWSQSNSYRAQVKMACTGTSSSMQNLSQDQFKGFFVGVPGQDEQQTIVAHLDRETARIDALIEKKARFIELLREKRQALITHAVNKGLDPSAKMKDSGVEWLGDVPEHWDVLQLRHTACLESGHTPSRSQPAYWVNCTIPWFTLADVWQVRSGERKYVYETSEKVSQLGLENSSARLLPAGSVFLSRTASVGFAGIMEVDMATSQDFAVWTCNSDLFNEFLYYVLLGMKPDFDRLMMGSTHKTIYMPDIEAIRIARPPVNEQIEIVQVLNRQLGCFKTVIDKTEHSIALLKERRSALITAAVTGQIDLRESV